MKKLTLAFGLMLFTSGCLESEFTDVRIMRNQGKQSVFVAEAVNVYSDETDAINVQQDFDFLINTCREERETPTPENGFITQGCQILIQDGKIVLRSFGVVDEHSSDISVTDSEIIWRLKEAAGTTVETNGTVRTSGDDVLIVWPKDASELHIKVRDSNPDPEAHEPLLRLLKEYLR